MYSKMFQFVNELLRENDNKATKVGYFPFRRRSEHTRRVFMWTERLIEGEPYINKEAVLVSAIFHDVGYALSLDNSKHAENSAIICEKYLRENCFDTEFINFVVYLVKNHSNKELMAINDTPLELILLMEADLLDETGALSIVWDCMTEGSQQVQSFEKAYNHILSYSNKICYTNPMVTVKAKAFWENKQKFVQEFIKHLSFDLGIDENKP